MANISVRKLDEHVYHQLQLRAAQHGVSMEEEARQIISLVVSAPNSISHIFQQYFGPKHGIDLEIQNLHQTPHEPLDFDK